MYGSLVTAGLSILLATVATAHVLLHKDSPRSAVGWIGFIWLVPFGGVSAYALVGINRVWRHHRKPRIPAAPLGPQGSLERFMSAVSGRALTRGNAAKVLVDGDEAYPEMLEAIEGAESAVELCTYIYASDALGRRFDDALVAAQERGVEVRVLVDGVGAWYAWPPAVFRLRRRRVPTLAFSASLWPWRAPFLNLRNHRKLLCVDDRVAFVGGMNLRGHHLVAESSYPTRDLMMRLEGPIVDQVREVFDVDWTFAGGEPCHRLPPTRSDQGEVSARALPDGPDEDLDMARWTFIGAINAAERHVRILTPYFLPEADLKACLRAAAMRGVVVDIVLPERSNLPYVDWATRADSADLITGGCCMWLSGPVFDHSKLMVVDERWTWCGSANWDPRSLRLNFELGVELYDPTLARHCAGLIDERVRTARRLTLVELQSRPLFEKLRDGTSRLFKPYL